MIKATRVSYSRNFQKQLERAPIKIKEAFRDQRKLFNQDQFAPQLKNHQLTGKFKNYRSINITGDWRALYSKNKINKENVIIFEALGTHSQLYK